MEPRFHIPSALSMLYGIVNPVTFPGALSQAQESSPAVSFAGVRVVPAEAVRHTSYIGTPILLPVTFRGGTYKRYDVAGRVVDTQLGELRLPASTVVEMSTTKQVTKTTVSASGGTVKEVFAFGDWDIRLTGIILDESNHPHGVTTVETMEQRIQEFDALADSIGVDAELFNRRGIDRLVIRSLSFSQIPGRPRMVGFQMQCDSDAPLELLIR